MGLVPWSVIGRRVRPIESHEIERAVESEQLFVMYRPHLRLSARTATPRVDALLHWRHPNWGVMAADAFMAEAARTGLATTLTEWLLTAALRQTRAWRRAGDDVDLSIDLCSADLHPYLAGTLAAALEFSGAAPAAITCALAEDAIAQDADLASHVAAELQWLGVRVAIDKFGRTSGSLSRLGAMPVDELRLAPELVEDLAVSAERVGVAVAAVAAAQALGISVVACGVRTRTDLATVRALGCDFAEGPAISEPLEPLTALSWLRARSYDG